MADKVERLLANENDRRRLGDFGKVSVSSLVWENSVPHLLNTYDHLFKAKTRKASGERLNPSAAQLGSDGNMYYL